MAFCPRGHAADFFDYSFPTPEIQAEEEKKDEEKYSADVSFIGSLYTEKCPYNRLKEETSWLKGYLDGVIEAQLKVYGYNFLEECLTDQVL